mgnify:CR=1 FL=1
MALYIGLDIGGTKCMVASATSDIKIKKRIRKPTPPLLEDGLALLHEMIDYVSDGNEIAAIGAAIGGPLDWKRGIVSPLHQPAWREVPLKIIMEKKWGCPFHVDIDTNVAAIGEYTLGGYQNTRFFYMTISTGIGGGFLLNGKIYRGMQDTHPEVGHQSIHYRCSNPQDVQCECGAPDCLEALASGNGIRRIYGKPPEQLNDTEWDEVTYNLSQGIRNLTAFYLPEVIVLGGGIANARGVQLISGIAKLLPDYLKILPIPQIRISKLGYDTALMGALAIAKSGLT